MRKLNFDNGIKSIRIGVSDILLKIIARTDNGFEKKELNILYQLLNAIEHYPDIVIPFTRVGININYESHSEEIVIKFEEDFLILNKEGIERTGFGSDSYEKDYCFYVHSEIVNKIKKSVEIDIEKLEDWYNEAIELLACENLTFSIEHWN